MSDTTNTDERDGLPLAPAILVGSQVRRRPFGRSARVTSTTETHIRIRDHFWHGWVTRKTF